MPTVTKPTDILMNEHRVIERVLDCLERIAGDALDQRKLQREQAADALEVITTFADRCHHGKEENVLFTALERRGFPRQVGPMAVMLHEHELGRAAVARMRDALAADRSGDAQAPTRFATAAHDYIGVLRDHIAKEDGVLFPMAESILRDEDREQVLAGFTRTEASDMGAGTHERMLGIVNELARQLGVPERASQPGGHAGGCCHGHCH